MNIDYSYGNQYYQYFNNTGIKSIEYEILAPEQSQNKQPGMEYLMDPRPIFDNPNYKSANKLKYGLSVVKTNVFTGFFLYLFNVILEERRKSN